MITIEELLDDLLTVGWWEEHYKNNGQSANVEISKIELERIKAEIIKLVK